jgi:hypothetical protein
MARQYSMPSMFPPVRLLPHAADAAGRTSGYINLRNALKVWIVCSVNQGNAAQVTFTPLQATNSAGAGSKAIKASPIWLNDATAASDALVKQASGAANFQTDATLADKIVIFELQPEAALDIANGFDEIAVQTSASSASNITGVEVYAWLAYEQATPPTVLV